MLTAKPVGASGVQSIWRLVDGNLSEKISEGKFAGYKMMIKGGDA